MLFGGNFHILCLFRKFEIGWKIVKNHGLTPLLFGEIFHLKITAKLHPKVSEISRKRRYMVETFLLRGYLDTLKLVKKSLNDMRYSFYILVKFPTFKFWLNFFLKLLQSAHTVTILSKYSSYKVILIACNWSKNRRKPWVNHFPFW